MQAKYFRFSTLAAAIACLGGTALANPAEVTINITVEPIAVLDVVEGSATVIMGSSDRVGYPMPTNELAHVQLSTNFCVAGIKVDYPRVTGLRGGFPNQWYGEATGLVTTNTLGVNPYAFIGTGTLAHGGFVSTLLDTTIDPSLPLPGAAANLPLSISGGSAGLCSPANGTFDIFLGVVSRWDLTLPPEPVFAAPDTYRIPLTVSIIP